MKQQREAHRESAQQTVYTVLKYPNISDNVDLSQWAWTRSAYAYNPGQSSFGFSVLSSRNGNKRAWSACLSGLFCLGDEIRVTNT